MFKYRIYIVLTLILLSSVFVYSALIARQKNSFTTCNANLLIFRDGLSLKGHMALTLSDSKGVINLNGIVSADKEKSSVINREIFFSRKDFSTFQIWESNENRKLSYDNTKDSEVSVLLQDFYLRDKTTITVMSKFTPFGNMLLVKSTMTVFLCDS